VDAVRCGGLQLVGAMAIEWSTANVLDCGQQQAAAAWQLPVWPSTYRRRMRLRQRVYLNSCIVSGNTADMVRVPPKIFLRRLSRNFHP
jgi:hypothetical protein